MTDSETMLRAEVDTMRQAIGLLAITVSEIITALDRVLVTADGQDHGPEIAARLDAVGKYFGLDPFDDDGESE